jgi:hypothetical protein
MWKGILETMPWPSLKSFPHLLCRELLDPGTYGLGKNAEGGSASLKVSVALLSDVLLLS